MQTYPQCYTSFGCSTFISWETAACQVSKSQFYTSLKHSTFVFGIIPKIIPPHVCTSDTRDRRRVLRRKKTGNGKFALRHTFVPPTHTISAEDARARGTFAFHHAIVRPTRVSFRGPRFASWVLRAPAALRENFEELEKSEL